MNRRKIFKSALLATAGLFAARQVAGAAPAPDVQKVVYHLSDFDKVGFVLGNMRNHIDGVGGPGMVKLALVVHGSALKAFQTISAHPDIASRYAGVAKDGVEMNACGNTMKAQEVTLKDLLPGFISADRGGVVRLAELQGQGYVYLRP